jgi:crotonobetainyl-CoA:carnitine CoA-transferase CaiB-like acyl-CoA transferase
MADLGADVIKIEEPGKGDPARKKPPFPKDIPDPEKSGLFLYLNTNKLGITLDPSSSEGNGIFRKLTDDSDILVEDHQVDHMEQMRLGYEDLKKFNPGLIMLAITAFGQSGPHKDYKAYQLNLSHVSGQGNILPFPAKALDRPPVQLGGNASNYDAGLMGAIGAMAALFWKGATGKGQYIDMSKQEALIAIQRVDSESFPNYGLNVTRMGMVDRRSTDGIVPCKDGYVMVLTPEEHQWKALVQLMGDPEWAKEDWCKDRQTRAGRNTEIKQLIGRWMKKHTKEEIFRKGQALSCPVAPISSPEEVVHSRQFNARGFFVEMKHPAAGRLDRFPSSPFRCSGTPWRLDRPAPRLGEHNASVYGDRLGYSKDDLAKLRESGVI